MQSSRFSINSSSPFQNKLPWKGFSGYSQTISQKRSVIGVPSSGGEELFSTADSTMKRIQERLGDMAQKSAPVMISGEAGVGKSMMARSLLRAGPYANKNIPFVVFDASAHSASDHDKQLLGESGKLLGDQPPRGDSIWQKACGGYLIIDHLEMLNLNLQNKLLKALSNKDWKRRQLEGSVPVRVVFLVSGQTTRWVKKNKIKSDLYESLAAHHIIVPPLRRRPQDISHLAQFYLEELASERGGQPVEISGGAMAKLVHYDWPGNVTELRGILAKVLSESDVTRLEKEHLPLKEETPEPQISDDWIKNLPVGEALRTVETHFILETIKSHRGNRTYAARTLGISLRTLRNKINEFTVEGYEVMSPQSGRRSASA